MLQPYGSKGAAAAGGGGSSSSLADTGHGSSTGAQEVLSCYLGEGAAAAAAAAEAAGASTTPSYLLVNGKMLRELFDEHVRLIGTFIGIEEENMRLIISTPDGTRVCCHLAHAYQQEEGEIEKVVVVCGRVSSIDPPTLSEAFFVSMGNELDVEQANEVLTTAHHSFFVSAFYPSRGGAAAAETAAAAGRDAEHLCL